MTYFSNYRPPIDDPTGQTKEHAIDQLSKFQLNPTVKESRNSILPKLCRQEKTIVVQRLISRPTRIGSPKNVVFLSLSDKISRLATKHAQKHKNHYNHTYFHGQSLCLKNQTSQTCTKSSTKHPITILLNFRHHIYTLIKFLYQYPHTHTYTSSVNF